MTPQSENNEYAEDAAILRFYNVDSFEPNVWIDAAEDDVTDREVTKQQFDQSEEGLHFMQQQQPQETKLSAIFENENNVQASMNISDPLGLLPSIFKNESAPKLASVAELRVKSTLMIYSKNFNPRHFLLQVHKDSSYNDLVLGEKRLRQDVKKQSEALKSLVHNNFDRFVTAKNTIDHVYEEMRGQQLNDTQEYCTRTLRLALEDAAGRADQIYGPVVERRRRVVEVRSTLSILQRYKFFFNLPSSLLESIKQNKYETVIRDYKRGKYLYQTLKRNASYESLQNDGKWEHGKEDSAAEMTSMHHKVFDKVWDEVANIIKELQNILLKMLADPSRSMDEQERAINFLLELDIKEDPAWFYLDSQYKWIMGLMKETFTKNVEKVDKIKYSSSTYIVESITQRSLSLKHAISVIESKTANLDSDGSIDACVWKAINEVVKSMSSLLVRCLPDFWRLSKTFIEGKLKNKFDLVPDQKSGGSRRHYANVDLSKVEQCQSMSRNIVDSYASLLSSYLSLDETMEQHHNSDDPNYTFLSFIPVNSNSIQLCESLTRIMGILTDCIDELNCIHLPGEVFAGLMGLMDKAKSKFVGLICHCWERDAKNFCVLEDWVLDPYNPQCTSLLKRYYDYHKFCARSAYKIASKSVASDEIGANQLQVRPIHVAEIRSSFLESTLLFLADLVELAVSDYKPLHEKKELLLPRKREKNDVRSMDVRVLLTVSNLAHMRSTVAPKLVNLFETAFKVNMEEVYKDLIDVLDKLDRILFSDYIERKSTAIRDIIHHGILMSGINWYGISKPTEVHSFVYEALMTLVMVHSQISGVAKQFVFRSLSFLLEAMVNDCLESFRQVERFGVGGMLQATLEMEFMHQTLSQYITPAASYTLQLIYQTIEHAYDQQQQHSGTLQSELSHLKELLVYSRKSTAVQFLCFKPNEVLSESR